MSWNFRRLLLENESVLDRGNQPPTDPWKNSYKNDSLFLSREVCPLHYTSYFIFYIKKVQNIFDTSIVQIQVLNY